MRWCSAVSEAPDPEQAVAELGRTIDAALQGASPDLLVLFLSGHPAPSQERVPGLVRRAFGHTTLVGCSTAGAVGPERAPEGDRAMVALAATLPGVRTRAFHIDAGALPAREEPAPAWARLVGVDPGVEPQFLLMPDPFTCEVERLLAGLDLAWPGTTKVGGNASGGSYPGATALLCRDRVHRVGAVGLAMWGDIAIDAVVAQGCRPVGKPMLITGCEGNVVRELNSEPPVQVLRALYATLPPRDRALFRSSLFIGVEMHGDQEEYGAGDFLVRNITGMGPEDGAIAIGTVPEPWQAVQFHLRDAESAALDIRAVLDRHLASPRGADARGVLQFSCLGRGLRLPGLPDIDALALRERLPGVPLCGMFCNGEIGPVGGRTFLHGHTTVFALFRPAGAAVA